MDDRRLDPSGDPGHAEVAREIWAPPELPDDLRRMGLTRNTEEGAMIELAANLDPARPSHVAMAWVLLLVLVGIPALVTLAGVVRS